MFGDGSGTMVDDNAALKPEVMKGGGGRKLS
jgi:hypothetical protein